MLISNERHVLRMKVERLKHGWSQSELAYFARMSPSDVSRIEKGRMAPYPVQTRKLAAALHLDPATLTERVDVADAMYEVYAQ